MRGLNLRGMEKARKKGLLAGIRPPINLFRCETGLLHLFEVNDDQVLRAVVEGIEIDLIREWQALLVE